MTPEDTFLQDILANPDDDTPRMVYADWLDDRDEVGDEARADFIRVQCELAQLREEDGDEDRIFALEERERALLARHEERWIKDLPESAVHWDFRRGFLDDVRFEEANAETLCELGDFHTPYPIQLVSFGPNRGGSGHGSVPHPAPWTQRVVKLRLEAAEVPIVDDPPINASLGGLLAWENWERLQHLELNNPERIRSYSSHFLTDACSFPSLEKLSLRVAQLTNHDVAELARSDLCRRIHSLGLRGGASAKALRPLLTSELAPQWRELHLDGNQMAQYLLREMRRCTNLRRLSLTLGDSGLPQDLELPALEELSVTFGSQFGDLNPTPRLDATFQSLTSLARAGNLKRIRLVDSSRQFRGYSVSNQFSNCTRSWKTLLE